MFRTTPVCSFFLIACLLICIPSSLSGHFFRLFSGELPHTHWWQHISMVFQHGEKGQPAAILLHLGLNLILLFTCGRYTEKLIGSKRFLILSLSAWLFFILTQWISGVWINGASGIIWAYSPFLLWPISQSKKYFIFNESATQAKVLLFIMWGLVTLIMGFFPLVFNPNHSLGYSFFFGNLFHAVATVVGFVFYFRWKGSIALPNSHAELHSLW